MTERSTFTISDHSQNGSSVLALGGELDIMTSPQLGDALSAISARSSSVVLDLQNLSFIDSTGLTILVVAQQRLHSTGGNLRLVGVRPNVKRVFEVTGLTEVFSMDAAADDSMSV